MRCSTCHHENRADRRFCTKCGTPLGVACGACGALNEADEHFCGSCGVALSSLSPASSATAADLPAAIQGERRQLTVLFCDLVGSTELSVRFDPEDWREIGAQYQRTVADAASRFGGHVAKFLGDGVVVYFGWPHAHDNDAERAVRGGLAILAAMADLNERLEARHGIRLASRIGTDTGLVVIGEGGGTAAEVFGKTPNVAARVQALAGPDTIFITAATHRLVAGLFVVDEEGAHELKGVAEPVTVYRVRRVSSVRRRLDVAAASGLTPFVGREEERQLLRRRWEHARDGEGRAVLIMGEAGIGKSRLLHVLKQDLASEPHTWIDCAGSPYHQNTPFFPVVDMLQQGLAWRGDESAEQRLAALQRALEFAGVAVDDSLPLIAPLLGLPVPDHDPATMMSREGQRRKLLASLTAWLLGTARAQPVVVVVEDLHWVDSSTLELLGLLSEQAATAPILLLYTARREFRVPWSTHQTHDQLTLNRLDRRHVREMVGRVAPDATLAPQLVEAVVVRSDGVPLFAEELARHVAEGGGWSGEQQIPQTLHDLLMARLDRLGAAKEVAQVGAVIGREFTYALLEPVCGLPGSTLDAALATLAGADLLYPRGTKPDASYVFKHALVRDAAYGSLLKSRRRELHQTIARVLGERFPRIVETEPELVAHHYTEGGCPREGLPQWQRAGQRALERSANAEAVSHFRRALALIDALPEGERAGNELMCRMPLGVALIACTGYASDEVALNIERLRGLCQELGTAYTFGVLFAVWFLTYVRAERESTMEMSTQLLELAQQTKDPTHLLLAHQAMAAITHWMSDAEASRRHCAEVLELHDPVRDRGLVLGTGLDPWVSAHLYDSGSLWLQGFLDQSIGRIHACLPKARETGHPLPLAGALSFGAVLLLWRREPEGATAMAEEMAALAREHGLPVWLGFALAESGQAKVQQGDAAAGRALIDEGYDIYLRTGARLNVAGMLCARAEACIALGDVGSGLVAVEEGLGLTARQIDRTLEPELHRLKGELVLIDRDERTAEAEFTRAMEIAHERGARSWELRAATSLARLWHRQDKHGPALYLLEPLYAWFTEGFQTGDLLDAKALLKQLR